jgi:hypothetical protein
MTTLGCDLNRSLQLQNVCCEYEAAISIRSLFAHSGHRFRPSTQALVGTNQFFQLIEPELSEVMLNA